jgi:hypothetical protein
MHAAQAALFICAVSVSAAAQQPYYVTRAVLTQSDSAVSSVIVYIDIRTLAWLNATLLVDRRDLQESAACLHIAQRMPPDGFKVDSIARGTRSPGDTVSTTWRATNVVCDSTWAPIHFHVITPQLNSWLRSQGLDDYIGMQCVVTGADVASGWSKYPFNAMQCGLGVDSIIAYRVKKRGAR